MFGKKICTAVLLGMALASAKLMNPKIIQQQDYVKSHHDQLIQNNNNDDDSGKKGQEIPIVVNPRNHQPQVKQLFEPFKKVGDQKEIDSQDQRKISAKSQRASKQSQKTDGHNQKEQLPNPEAHSKLIKSNILGQMREIKSIGQKTHLIRNQTNDNQKNQVKPRQEVGELKVESVRDKPKGQNISKSKNRDKRVTVSVKVPDLPKLLTTRKQENQVDWMVSHDSESQKIPKDGKDKRTRLPNDDRKQDEHLSSQSSKQKIPEKRDEKSQYLSKIDFQNPQVSSSLISQTPIDQFHPPIEIHSGQLNKNRLSSQYAVLNIKTVPQIWRQVDLKPGSYRLSFDWQSNQSGGEIQLFWNHRLIGSFKSFDIDSSKQTVQIKSLCGSGKNILKFVVTGPVPVGIDNIQITK